MIQADFLGDGQIIAAIHLSPSGDSRYELVNAGLSSERDEIVLVEESGPRSDQAQVAAQYRKQLRQFVETGETEKAADRGEIAGWVMEQVRGYLGRICTHAAKFGHFESIPEDWRAWNVNAKGAGALAATLARERENAFLFRTLATLRTDIRLFDSVDELKWAGPKPEFEELGKMLNEAVSDDSAERRAR